MIVLYGIFLCETPEDFRRGGLGLMGLKVLNQPFLGKWVRRLGCEPVRGRQGGGFCLTSTVQLGGMDFSRGDQSLRGGLLERN